MKYLLYILLFGIIIKISLFAQPKDLSGIKFCIDPGHGGHNESNDRHVVPDPGIDWESESNFQKALWLKPLLEAKGAWVILTRYTNDYPNDNDEPSLAARVALANANNVNWFHSIHSNAAGGINTSINYTLMLVREKRSSNPYESSAPGLGIPERQESLPMANILGKNIYSDNRTSRTTTYLDWTFYGGANGGFSLGVLRGLSMPGELSEGSFHDYYPETRRLMNNDYRKMEAYAIRNSFMEYFGMPKDTSCIIAGIVKDAMNSKPINKIKITLQPVGKVYNGDSYNNGYFLFDNLYAGDYTIVYEANSYMKDSVKISILAGSISYADKNLIDNSAPTILSSQPVNSDSAVTVLSAITLNFSKKMDTASVRGAFSINPTISGILQWSNSNSTLSFKPLNPFDYKTQFVVTIAATAKDYWGYVIDGNRDAVPGDPYTLKFKTLSSDAERPFVLSSFPTLDSKTTDFSTSGVISITFNKLMDTVSLKNSGISFRAYSQDQPIELIFNNFQEKTIVTIRPKNPLETGRTYVAVVWNTVKDIFQNVMQNTTYFYFQTGSKVYTGIIPLESFSGGIANWKSPTYSQSTIGIVPENTTNFEESSIYLPGMKDNKSMGLNYEWDKSASAFLIREYLFQGPLYNSLVDTSLVLQTYIFGDGSKNRIRLCVDDNTDLTDHRVNNWMTIDWYGWKLIEWKFSNQNELGYWFTSGPIVGSKVRFDSYQLSYDPVNGKPSGTIYFDELRVAKISSSTTSVDNKTNSAIPQEYILRQNYPNPFNPSTVLSFSIPETRYIKLVIYNVAGKQIETLAEGNKEKGNYTIRWIASGLPGGVYFAYLIAGEKTYSIKMLLVK